MPPRNPSNDDNTGTPERPVTGTVVKPVLSTVAPLPDILVNVLDLSAWAESLVNGVKYHEPDPNYLSRLLITQTLTSETADDVFEQAGIRKLQEAVPNVPGAETGPFELTMLYVTESDFGEGAPCYMLMDLASLDTGMVSKYSTGATGLQAQLLRLLSLGCWPIRGNIKRLDRKDKGGRFLFWLYPPD